ncbi:Acetoin catabolism regulatory protein [Pandoraea terrae]|uniref:Acetoin catabolism regulatory protein n=1 Tax=Pandoraea terrae TaxID=1537710 RepID=A0A5E4SVA9_9BURK|nr:sigma 54-interacting transcriptional regulator [Pandoraea terrae]VVD79846.1 Acetoin catabolism regulatory protein [Pandoraea terrae]
MPAHLAVAPAPARPASACPASRQSAPEYLAIDDLCGEDAQMQALIARGKRFIERGLPILILGETGTGKEFLARALHDYSERRAKALVAINTASIPEHLVESELFGYSRGAFSGALPGGMKGKLQQADGGTLFLDEIGDMPLVLQTRLLRVLSEREVTPLGTTHPVPVDVQLICATHQNLPALVAEGMFRQDLYYRIAVGVLQLPTLRARTDRRGLIARMLCDEWPQLSAAQALQKVSPAALERMLRYSWPGNLRQLRAAIRFACAVASGPLVELRDLPQELLAGDVALDAMPAMNLPPALPSPELTRVSFAAPQAATNDDSDDISPQACERDRILQALACHRWNISAAARTLGLCRASLYRRLKHLRIPHMRDCAHEIAMGQSPALAS